ncbi:hypothetical protein CRYUN_Cryun20dG0042300 [Craigia yunnanensis]
MEYRCVKCGFRVKTLFVQYSPGNIRLMKCENCKSVADEYVECELMIVFIDLIFAQAKSIQASTSQCAHPTKYPFSGSIVEVIIWFSCSRCLNLLKTSARFSRRHAQDMSVKELTRVRSARRQKKKLCKGGWRLGIARKNFNCGNHGVGNLEVALVTRLESGYNVVVCDLVGGGSKLMRQSRN